MFAEWERRGKGVSRDLARSKLLARLMGVDLAMLPPTILVVGSKGKGTACAYASAHLDALGLHVVSVTSPPFRTNRERIRLDGRAISNDCYSELSQRVGEARRRLPSQSAGYLSPTGAFLAAGLALAVEKEADALVIEEGLGGRSDDVSMLKAAVVAVTAIFEEHIGVIGSNVAEIADDLLGVVGHRTRCVITLPQSEPVDRVISRHAHAQRVPVETIQCGVQYAVIDPVAANARLGVRAAEVLATLLEPSRTISATTDTRIPSLPGRRSFHRSAQGQLVAVDASIDPSGVAGALSWCDRVLEPPDLVLACFPSTKRAAECFSILRGRRVIPVVLSVDHLDFIAADAPGPLVSPSKAFREAAFSNGVVLCVGTMSFIGEVLDWLDVSTDDWWPVSR